MILMTKALSDKDILQRAAEINARRKEEQDDIDRINWLMRAYNNPVVPSNTNFSYLAEEVFVHERKSIEQLKKTVLESVVRRISFHQPSSKEEEVLNGVTFTNGLMKCVRCEREYTGEEDDDYAPAKLLEYDLTPRGESIAKELVNLKKQGKTDVQLRKDYLSLLESYK